MKLFFTAVIALLFLIMSNSVFAQINCDDYKKTSSEYNTCKLKLFMSKSKKKLNEVENNIEESEFKKSYNKFNSKKTLFDFFKKDK